MRAAATLLPAAAALLIAGASSSCAVFFSPRDLHPAALPSEELREAPGPLLAGAARADITPCDRVLLGGFGVWRRSDGAHDPLWARALAVRRGSLTAVIVSVDLIGLHHHHVEEARRRLAHRVPPGAVLIAATHNHAGPDTLGLWGLPPFVSGVDVQYIEIAIQGIVRAAEGALDALGPVRVRWGSTRTFELSRNLREPNLLDPALTALVFERPGGAPVAALVHFACHPEVLGSRNRTISADFPGALYRAIEEGLPGSVALYLNGSLGGMVTTRERARTFEEVDRIGRSIAEAALGALEAGALLPADNELMIARQSILVPVENWRYRLADSFSLFAGRPQAAGGYTPSEVQAIRIGPVVILSAPGEVLPRLGRELRALAADSQPFLLVSLGNDELGYLLHEDDYGRGLYSYERSMSPGRLAATLLRQAAGTVLRLVGARAGG